MSEYEIVAFRAIDRPLTAKQLEFMSSQSSRAEFSKWEFQVEYRYSSFHGDVDAMLRNGYDIFLMYSNYGCREIRIRLPGGLPVPRSIWSKYIGGQGFKWMRDKRGKAGILKIALGLEEGHGEVGEFDDYLDAIETLRAMLIDGDLRALYVLWLCGTIDSIDGHRELMEPPVPHGLGTLPSEVANLPTFFDVDPWLVEAAAIGIPAANACGFPGDAIRAWVTSLSDSRRTEIVQRFLSEDPTALKSELLSEIRDSRHSVAWPVERPARTVAQLLESCESLGQKQDATHTQKSYASSQGVPASDRCKNRRSPKTRR